MKSKGLGDSIEKVTKAVGIKQATDWIFDKLGKDCGCDKRKERLNKLFPYKTDCLEKQEYNLLKDFFSQSKNIVNIEEQKMLLTIHNRVFNTNKKVSTCSSCVRGLYDTMQKLYNEYEYEKEIQKN